MNFIKQHLKQKTILLVFPFLFLLFFPFAPHLVAVLIFAFCIAAIAVEKTTGFDKIVPSFIAFGMLWFAIGFFRPELLEIVDLTIGQQNEEVSPVVFMLKNSVSIVIFLMSAMIIVDYLNDKGAFGVFIDKMRNNKYLPGLILFSTPVIFFLSTIFDNMTTALIFAAITSGALRGDMRISYLGLVVISANSGGLISIVGDPPTTYMYLKHKISEAPTFFWGILPAMVAVTVPAYLLYKKAVKKNVELHWEEGIVKKDNFAFVLGICVLLAVPVGKYFFHLEPFLTISLSAGFVFLFAVIKNDGHAIEHVLKGIDWMGLGYFLTILGAVCALETLGTIHLIGHGIEVLMQRFSSVGVPTVVTIVLIAFVLGIVSAYVDNIPIVVLCVAVFTELPQDDGTWHVLNYFLNTGGSLTVIGSAAGVMLMNRYKIHFADYQRLVFRPAFWGYVSGGLVVLIQQLIFA